MASKVTIQDIADALGLSRNTVSKAINNTGVLADATRDRILAKAVEMGYKQFSYINATGVTSAAPCAAPDGTPALLVTYSRGSGIHRAILAFYHPGTQQLTGLATYWPARDDPGEMVILPPTLRTETPFSSYAIAEYPVWLAEVSILSSTDFTLVKPVGTVTENHGLHVDLDLTQWQP